MWCAGVGFVLLFFYKAVAVPLSRATHVVAEGEQKREKGAANTDLCRYCIDVLCCAPVSEMLWGSPSDAGLGQLAALKAP